MALGLDQFLILSKAEDASLLRWWKLHRSKRGLTEAGVRFNPTADESDLQACWSDQDYRLLPPEFPYPGGGSLIISPGFVGPFRATIRQRLDEHCARLPNRGYIRVQHFFEKAHWTRLQ